MHDDYEHVGLCSDDVLPAACAQGECEVEDETEPKVGETGGLDVRCVLWAPGSYN